MIQFTTKIVAAFLLILVLFNSDLFGELTNHLKKCENKTNISSTIEGIDFIYLINLDKRSEKFEKSSNTLKKYNINPYRFSAVNGWELSLQVINDLGLKYQPGMPSLFATAFPLEAGGQISHEFMKEIGKTYFAHETTLGAIGCSLSHISILKDAWDSGYETIWVLEDDIDVILNPHILSLLIHHLDNLVGKENWDVLFTDQNSKRPDGEYVAAHGAPKRPDLNCSVEERFSEKYLLNKQIDPHFKKIGARFGTYSMIIRRSGIKKLLDFAMNHQIFSPYDCENFLAPNLNRYTPTYDVVSTLTNAVSDLKHW